MNPLRPLLVLTADDFVPRLAWSSFATGGSVWGAITEIATGSGTTVLTLSHSTSSGVELPRETFTLSLPHSVCQAPVTVGSCVWLRFDCWEAGERPWRRCTVALGAEARFAEAVLRSARTWTLAEVPPPLLRPDPTLPKPPWEEKMIASSATTDNTLPTPPWAPRHIFLLDPQVRHAEFARAWQRTEYLPQPKFCPVAIWDLSATTLYALASHEFDAGLVAARVTALGFPYAYLPSTDSRWQSWPVQALLNLGAIGMQHEFFSSGTSNATKET